MGELLPLAAQIWPGGDQYPAVPLLILALAAWSAQKGPTASARVGCVLFWFVLIMYLAVLGIGISSVKWKWIAPQSGPVRPLAALLLLIPAGAAAVKKERSGWKPRLLLPGLLLLSASMITFGVLSAKLAAGSENAFFDLSRSLEIAGTARRFEAVISAGMTVGWFSLLSLCLVLCAQSAGRIHERAARPAVYLAAAMSAGYMLLKTPISETFLLILGAVFWVVLPLLTQGIEKLKKS